MNRLVVIILIDVDTKALFINLLFNMRINIQLYDYIVIKEAIPLMSEYNCLRHQTFFFCINRSRYT